MENWGLNLHNKKETLKYFFFNCKNEYKATDLNNYTQKTEFESLILERKFKNYKITKIP